MKDSLFVFQKGAIDSSSVTENNLGTNLDFFAVPTSSLTSISALEGKIVLYFKSSNVFENSKANQAKVTLNTTQGLEPRAAIATWNFTLEEGQVYIFDDVGSIYPSSYSDSISGIDSIIRPTTERFTGGGGGGATTIDVLSSTDVVLGTVDSSVPDTVKLMDAVLSYAKVGSQGQITTTSVTPSGIAYQELIPCFNESFVTGDSWDNFINGNYIRINPVYPVGYARVEYNSTQADVRVTPASGTSATDAVAPTILEKNNAFGNKFRYTDDAGNASDASVGSNIWAHVDWNNHSWTGATQYYVIDHLTGFGFTVKYEDDAGKVNLNTTGNSWSEWLTYIDATHHGMTGWMPLDLGELNNAHGARVQPNMVWADEFFEFDPSVSGSTRGGFMTGESYDTSNLYILYDSGNADLAVDLTKAKNSGFHSRLTNCFMKRKHY
ncbi:MAG: hypothetical protein Unbinned1473contig1000_54 [Prokaryotic dsDNA virus sp.]|nr:MAG: hypothetical protein Unbinned1473contig1000_54 [Prokaryotic dsDNA virus sp.]|tara:strand:- start:6285 stop:7595 length:1311 start_codon:yes stop_codon:yes gene_type:complete